MSQKTYICEKINGKFPRYLNIDSLKMFLPFLQGINLFEPNTTFFIVLFLDHRILLTKMPLYNYTAIISISLFSFL